MAEFVQITVDPRYLNMDLAYKVEPWKGHVPQAEGQQTGVAVWFLGGPAVQCEIVVGVSVAQLVGHLGYSPPVTDAEDLLP